MDKKEIGYSHQVCLSIGIFHNILQKDIKNIFALVPPILLKLYINFFFLCKMFVCQIYLCSHWTNSKGIWVYRGDEDIDYVKIERHSLVNYSNWYLVPHRQWIQYNHLFIYYGTTCSFSTKEVMIMLPQVSEVSTPDLSNSI